MPKIDEAPIIELGVKPIGGAAPTGTDVADDEEYLFCGKQIAKIGRLDADAEDPNPDWYQTEQNATNILRTKSKDAEVAAWLGMALFQRVGFSGLAASLSMITELVKNFWDGMYPERPRRRKARIESLCDIFASGVRVSDGGWFKDHKPNGNDDYDALDLCLTRVEELKKLLTEKMPDDPPDFSKFVRCGKEVAATRPKAAAPAQPAAAAAGGEGGAPRPAGGGGSFSAGEVADAGGAINAIFAAVTFLRKADPTDPISYGVSRVLKWAKLMLPADSAARTQIEPPEKTTVEALTHQMANGVWEHLLNGSEAAFRSSDPLWLDLQRYTCAAMMNLGPQFEKARQTIMGQTGALVRRLGDGLFELKFKTGQPLCSGETKMWIESDVSPPSKGGGGADMGNGKLTEAADKARKLAGTGKLKEAVAELQEGAQTCTQRRDRFLWRLRIAQLCFDAKRIQLATPLLEECYEEIQRYHIEEWEPTLAVEVASVLYRCRKALTSGDKPAPEALQSVRESFTWLCQLDPVAALAAEPAGT